MNGVLYFKVTYNGNMSGLWRYGSFKSYHIWALLFICQLSKVYIVNDSPHFPLFLSDDALMSYKSRLDPISMHLNGSRWIVEGQSRTSFVNRQTERLACHTPLDVDTNKYLTADRTISVTQGARYIHVEIYHMYIIARFDTISFPILPCSIFHRLNCRRLM